MAKKFGNYLIGMIVIGLFIISLISIGLQIGGQSDASMSIENETAIKTIKESIETNIEEGYSTVADAENSTSSSAITTSSGIPFIDAIGGIWKTIKIAPTAIYESSVTLINSYLLGSDSGTVILSAVGAIVIITIIFAVWRMISTGDGG